MSLANQGGPGGGGGRSVRLRGAGQGDRGRSDDQTLYIPNGEFNHSDIIDALSTSLGENQVLRMVNTTGNWHITLKGGGG